MAKTKYRTLTDAEVTRVIKTELDLEGRWRRMALDSVKRLARISVEKIPPKTLSTQLDAILKLGASRNPKALEILRELSRGESYTPHYSAQDAVYREVEHENPGDGSPLAFAYTQELVKEAVPAHDGPTRYWHPRAKAFLAKSFSHTFSDFYASQSEGLNKLIGIAIDTSTYDLEPK